MISIQEVRDLSFKVRRRRETCAGSDAHIPSQLACRRRLRMVSAGFARTTRTGSLHDSGKLPAARPEQGSVTPLDPHKTCADKHQSPSTPECRNRPISRTGSPLRIPTPPAAQWGECPRRFRGGGRSPVARARQARTLLPPRRPKIEGGFGTGYAIPRTPRRISNGRSVDLYESNPTAGREEWPHDDTAKAIHGRARGTDRKRSCQA